MGEAEVCASCKKYNITYCDDIVSCLDTMKLSEVVSLEQKYANLPKHEPIKDNEWVCEFCATKNIMTSETESAVCSNPNCKQKNEVVEYMI